jgi:hypothetical protein
MNSRIAGAALAALTLVAAGTGRANTVNYGFVESLNVPTLDRGGVTVRGSANVTMYVFGGLGIAGGDSNRVDGINSPPEYVEFSFDAGAATDVSWTTGNASDGPDAGNVLGDATVEAWDKNGNYLGSGATSAGAALKELDIYFGDAEYSKFRLTSGVGDTFDVRSVTFTPVPEPATGAVLGAGMAFAVLRRRRLHLISRSVGREQR